MTIAIEDAIDILRLIAEGHPTPRQLAQGFFEKFEVKEFTVMGEIVKCATTDCSNPP
jgi:hypothetical protein